MIAGQVTRPAVAAAGDRILLVRPDGHEATGHEVEASATVLALALGKQGLSGQRIGLWSWNSAAAIEAHLATEWIGATRVPVDPGAPPTEAAAVFKAAGVSGVVVDAAHVTDAPAGALVHDDDSPLSATGTLEAREIPPDTTYLLYPGWRPKASSWPFPCRTRTGRPAWQSTPSCTAAATTGRLRRHRTVPDRAADHARHRDARHISIHPHGPAPGHSARFDAAAVLEAAVRNRATATFMVPGMVTRLVDAAALAGATLPQAGGLRRIIYGGAPIAADDLTRAVSIMGPVLVQVYGRFEGGCPLAILSTADHVH